MQVCLRRSYRDLRRAQDMAVAGVEFDPDVAEPQFLAIGDGLRGAGETVAITQPHHVERLLRGEHRAMAGLARAWSEWPWVITARLTGRTGSMWKSPGLQHSPAATGIKDVSRTHPGYIGRVATIFNPPHPGRGRRAEAQRRRGG